MNKKYVAIPTTTLSECNRITHPYKLPKLVDESSPAVDALVDFKYYEPLTVFEHERMFDARKSMESNELHLTLVLNQQSRLVGLLSLEDVLGNAPIKLIEETRVHSRKEVEVQTVMTPIDDALMINIDKLRFAKVGNVVKTLLEHQTNYALVIEQDKKSKQTNVRGYFRAQRISKQMGVNIMDEPHEAHSIVELLHAIE